MRLACPRNCLPCSASAVIVGCVVGLACTLLQGCSRGPAAADSYFKCIGSIALHGLTLEIEDHQEIAAHVAGEKILFSGNDLLGGGPGIQICPAGALDTSPDEYYFDSDGCSTTKTGKDRVYGTLNRITHALQLSHTPDKPMGDVSLVTSKFSCVPAEVKP